MSPAGRRPNRLWARVSAFFRRDAGPFALLRRRAPGKGRKTLPFAPFRAGRAAGQGAGKYFGSNKRGILDECCPFLYTGKTRKQAAGAERPAAAMTTGGG